MKYSRLFIVIYLGIFLMPNASYAKVSETTLVNGMRVVVKEDHRFPVLVSQIWYAVGSSYEYGGISGLSHMLEHMMFKGTKKFSANEFSKIIAANGGRENAFTGRDYTAYYQMMAKDMYPLIFELESDRMRNIALSEIEFKRERNVVAEERRMRTDDNPSSSMMEQFFATAYTTSPYHHPVIGWADDIKNYQLDDLTAWYKKWYVPNNAILVVAGDVDPEKVFAEAAKWFSPISKSKLIKPKPQIEQDLKMDRSITLYSKKVKVPSITMGVFVPSILSAKQKWEPYALEVLAYILDGGNSSRISKEVIRRDKVASSAWVSYDPLARLKTLFIMHGIPTEMKNVAAVKEALWSQIERLQNKPVTENELNRIKSQLVASQIFERDSVFYQALLIGRFETVGLSWRDAEFFVDKLKSVTPKQIQQVAQKYFNRKKMVTAILRPEAVEFQHSKIKDDKKVGQETKQSNQNINKKVNTP